MPYGTLVVSSGLRVNRLLERKKIRLDLLLQFENTKLGFHLQFWSVEILTSFNPSMYKITCNVIGLNGTSEELLLTRTL